MKKYIRVLLLAALVCSLLAGCSIETKSSKDSQDESKYHLYYLNESETVLREEPYSPGEETADFMVKDLMQKLGSKDAPDGEISLLPEDVSINSYEVQKDLLVIDFSKEYSKMSKIREVMTRDGVVQTFLQIPDIHKVQFTVGGQPLTNSRNQEVGEMTSDTFAQYTGKDKESYRYDTFTLYFMDKNGKNLVSGAFYTEKSGYPLDISLCNDGKKLAVSMLTVNNGEVCSTIKCYNFGSVGQNEIDYMVGSFDYPDVIIPQIEFTDNNRLVAFGDSKIILFSGTQKPEPDDEIALNQEIKSVFTSENYIGIIYNNDVQAESDTESTEESRHMEIYNTGGKHVLSKDFTMDYENVDFLGNGEICIRNATECQIYNTYGVKKFSYTFDTPLYDVISDGSQNGYIFIMEGTTEKVRLK